MKPHVQLLLTARTAISHHDPASTDKSNVLTFNRQKQFVQRPVSDAPVQQAAIDAFCGAFPVPESIVDVMDGLSFAQFALCGLVKLFIDTYNSADGAGLFYGIQRYEMLEGRLHAAAVRSGTLPGLWERMTRDMKVAIQPIYADANLALLFGLPLPVKQSMLSAALTDYRTAVVIARLWSSIEKQASKEYADAAFMPLVQQTMLVRQFDAATITPVGGTLVVEVPAVSANSMRHQLVREPSWQYLWQALGIKPGVDQMPDACEALFVNGGNIKAGAKQPRNSWAIAHAIKAAYPSLELLGGVVDSFDLGESRLSVSSWLVCAENADALAGTCAESAPEASISAFDMLDDVTATRQATGAGVGQMIYNFETLAKGAKIMVGLYLSPYTSQLARGALGAAIGQFMAANGTVAGQSARGFGLVDADIAEGNAAYMDGDVAAYAEYLTAQHDELREGILTGTLMTKEKILA